MRLSQLLTALPQREARGNLDREIVGLAHDSRRVQPGDLFVAIKGLNADGHDYIPEALERGAAAVVVQDARCMKQDLLHPASRILVPDSRQALAHLAAAFHSYPARKLRLIGVTGTDGKTTTINLIRVILEAARRKTGMISTVDALIGGQRYDTGLHTTTPDALDVQGYLARMVAAGAEYALLEVTSHGLDQHRTTACDFDVAVVTNISHEHLDYHGTYEQYREAKARLFRGLATSFRKPDTSKVAILNADDLSFHHLRSIPADVQLTYAINNPADVVAQEIEPSPSGVIFKAVTPQGDFKVETPLIGGFNVYNILAAIAVGLSQGISHQAMQEGIRSFAGVRGRMERIDLSQDFTVIVDFAHTPNSLEEALKTARTLTEGQVIVVFGCAGLRDRAKRPLMGQISGRLADRIVITAEDPRTEDLNEIMAQIAAGCEKAGRQEGVDYWRIGDRGEAVDFAINLAQRGDLVIVTGKGHERSMCYGETEYPWSDHEAVRKALERRIVA